MNGIEQNLARQGALVSSLFVAHETGQPMFTSGISSEDMLILSGFARDLSDIAKPSIYRCTTPIAEITYLPNRRQAVVDWLKGNMITAKLTPSEGGILSNLMIHQGHVRSKKGLYQALWQEQALEGGADGRVIDVHVRRLRTKLGDDNRRLIATLRSAGYYIPALS